MKKTLRAKHIIAALLVLALTVTLCGCAAPEIQTQNPDGSLTVIGVIIEQAVNLFFKALEAAVMIFAAWALGKFGSNKNLQSINTATQLVCDMAIQTAGELQQTIVDDLKAKSPNGKLTGDQVHGLACRLLNMTKAKLSDATKALVIASGADLDAIITGACENQLSSWNSGGIPLIVTIPDDCGEPE